MNNERRKLKIKTELLLIIAAMLTLVFMEYFNNKNLLTISALTNFSGCLIMVILVVSYYKKAGRMMDEEKYKKE